MSVKIRLARGGRKKIARFRIVAADSRFSRDGRFLETLGWYNPQAEPKEFKINVERVSFWTKLGAEVSETVTNLMKQDRYVEKVEALEKGLSLDTLTLDRKPESTKKKVRAKDKKKG